MIPNMMTTTPNYYNPTMGYNNYNSNSLNTTSNIIDLSVPGYILKTTISY